MTTQKLTVLNMTTFVQVQSLLLLDHLNEIDLVVEADLCEKRHEPAEHLYKYLSVRLGDVQGGE